MNCTYVVCLTSCTSRDEYDFIFLLIKILKTMQRAMSMHHFIYRRSCPAILDTLIRAAYIIQIQCALHDAHVSDKIFLRDQLLFELRNSFSEEISTVGSDERFEPTPGISAGVFTTAIAAKARIYGAISTGLVFRLFAYA